MLDCLWVILVGSRDGQNSAAHITRLYGRPSTHFPRTTWRNSCGVLRLLGLISLLRKVGHRGILLCGPTETSLRKRFVYMQTWDNQDLS